MTTLTPLAAADLFRDEPHKFLDAGVGEVAYRKVGAGPDVLFVHGWPVSGATFRTLLPHLVDHVTCHLIDLPGAGSSRFAAGAAVTFDTHVEAVRMVVDQLQLDDVALVGHDSGGMIARHALAGDSRVRSMGLINTEQHQGLSKRFKMFLDMRGLPGFKNILGWAVGQPRLRRNKFLLGDAFADSALLDGEFDEFFLEPLHTDKKLLQASMSLLKSFDPGYLDELEALHRKIEVPVRLIWGDQDPFFPLRWTREMVGTFPDATLHVIEGAGLFSHEERPAEVSSALLPVLTG